MDLLRLGDLCVLDVEGDSYVSSEGVLDTNVFANVPQAGDRVNCHQSAFVIRLQQNYAAENKLRRKIEERGMTRVQAQQAFDPEMRQLFDARENEKRINAAEFDFKKGLEVRYGMIVQLQHKISEKYMMVTRQRMETRDGRKVVIDRNAGEAAWFRIIPSLRVHSEGEPVHLGDRVIFESVESGLQLCAAPSGADLSREVFGGRLKEATPFRVEVFRTWSDQNQLGRCLLGSDPVRLIHKEGDGCIFGDVPPVLTLGLGAEGTASAEPSAYVATSTADKTSSNGVWAFERAGKEPGPEFGKPSVSGGGNVLPWDGAVRILHVPSGRALAVVGFPGPDEERPLATSVQMQEISESEPLSPRPGAPGTPREPKAELPLVRGQPFAHTTLIDDAYAKPSETLFELESQYDLTTTAIGLDRYFFVRHIATGWYIHLAAADEALEYLNASAAAADAAEAEPSPPLLAASPRASVEEAAASVPRPVPPPKDGRLLVATPMRYDFDVFGCQLVEADHLRDVIFATICATDVIIYLEAFAKAADKKDVAFDDILRTLGYLILFVTADSDNFDMLTREGLPRFEQQVLLREQRVLDLCMTCVMAPFSDHSPFTPDDIRGGAKALQRVLKISQRLCWHMLRGCAPNRVHAAPYVERLQGLLGYSIGVANTLTEIFTDNDVLLDSISDPTVAYFLNLIDGNNGRQARYIDFLICLCMSRGKARRRNQWRICRMIVSERPEFLLQLSLVGAPAPSIVHNSFDHHHQYSQVMVRPHDSDKGREYFPAFSRASMMSLGLDATGVGGQVALADWISRTTPETLGYFNRCIDLLATLCAGRNTVNTPKLRTLLPYELAMTIVRHDQFPMPLRCKFVGVIRDLYVNADPHDEVVSVRHIRKWAEIDEDAHKALTALRDEKRANSATLGTPALGVDYRCFDDLYAFIQHFLAEFGLGGEGNAGQVASHVEKNEMIVELLQVLYELIRSGFVSIGPLRKLCKGLIKMLDGSNDKMGLPGERERDRYSRKRMVKTDEREGCDTLLIMEAKEWICKILWLVSTARLDLRLSLLLHQYAAEYFEAHGSADGSKPVNTIMGKDKHTKKGDTTSSTHMGTPPPKQYAEPYPAMPSAVIKVVHLDHLHTKLTSQSATPPAGAGRTASQSLLVGGVELGRASAMEPPAGFSAAPPIPIGGSETPPPSPPTEPATTASPQSIASPQQAWLQQQERAATAAENEPASIRTTSVDSMTKGARGLSTAMSTTVSATFMGGGGSRRAIKAYKDLLVDMAKVFNFAEDGDIVKILTDLTRYESQRLSFQAISLIVRQFEQRKTLVEAGKQVQVLVRAQMVETLNVLDQLVKRLRRLTANRRLYTNELYEAAWLLGELTVRCYEMDDGGVDDSASVSKSALTKTALDVDSADTICLTCVGRVDATEGLNEVTFKKRLQPGAGTEPRLPAERSTVWIAGKSYKVERADHPTRTLQLDKPVTGLPVVHATSAANDEVGSVWIQLESKVLGPDHDTQLLLSKLGASELALKLLTLPFDMSTVRPEEVQLRSVLCAATRLLKAMCNDFPLVQADLAKHLAVFAKLTEAQLLERDISPTECIIAICDGNRDACTKVPPEMVRDFAKLAGRTNKPRFLRFLRKIMVPGGNAASTIKRNQQLVVSALVDTREALVLFNDAAGKAERAAMIERNDLEREPRGKFVYHIELIAMLASMAVSDRPEDQEVKSFVRDIISLKDVIVHLTVPSLSLDDEPHILAAMLPLRANFLAMFKAVFIEAAGHTLVKPLPQLAGPEALATLLEELSRVLTDFTGRRLGETSLTDFREDEQAAKELAFVHDSVLVTLAAFFKSEHMLKAAIEDDIVRASEGVAKAVVAHLVAIEDHAEISPKLCYAILREIKKYGIAKVDGKLAVDMESDAHAESLSALAEGAASGLPATIEVTPAAASASASTTLASLRGGGIEADGGTKGEGAPAAVVQPTPQDTLLDFMDAFAKVASTDNEYDGLVKTFMDDVDTRLLRHKSEKQKKLAGKAHPNALQESFLACVISKLANGKVSEGAALTDEHLEHSLAALRILNEIMSMRSYSPRSSLDAEKDTADELAHRQDVMLRLDVPRICMMIAASASAPLCEQGLKLGVHLLQGGNPKVQAAFFHFMSDPRVAHRVEPYDGSSLTFLEKMRVQLRAGLQEIKEAKFYREQQREREEKFEIETGVISGATKAAMLQQIRKPFPSRSYVMDVLEFLRLLCEGHNTEMQDLLREQTFGSYAARVDLVSEIYNFFAALEADLDDDDSVSQATKCVETLTELCQGNISMGNSRLLTESKLIDICGRLVQVQSLAGVQHDKLNILRDSITTLLMALLEGTERNAERRMLLRLDIPRLAQICVQLYRDTQELEEKFEDLEDDLEELEADAKHGEVSKKSALAKVGGKIGAGVGKVGAVGGAVGGNLKAIGGNLTTTLLAELDLQATKNKLEASRDAGFSLYILLRHLLDFEAQDHSQHADQGVAGVRVIDVFQEPSFQEAKEFYNELVGSCEIFNQSGELERVFFRFPKLCLSLSHKRKHDLEWKVDRETPGAQLIQFIEASEELHLEMVHENALEQWWLWRFAKRRYTIATNSIFALSLLANLCLIVRSQYCVAVDGNYAVWNSYFCSTSAQKAVFGFANDISPQMMWDDSSLVPPNPRVNGFFDVQLNPASPAAQWQKVFSLALQCCCFVFGVLLCLSSVIVFVLDAFRHGYPRIHKMVFDWTKEYGFDKVIWLANGRSVYSFEDINKAVISKPYAHWWWFYPLCIGAFFMSFQLLFCMASFVASVISLTVSPYWFAFGLLDFASKSPEIRIVATVLGQNFRSILMTMIFMLLIIYMFAVIGYLHLAEWFFYVEEFFTGDDAAIPACTSLLQCFITVLDDGLRANDIGSFVEPIRSPDTSALDTRYYVLFYMQSLYSLLFWFIVCIILLNVVFGIIIDSFGELRLHRQMIQGKIDNECFICGIDRFTLDTQGGGFEKHTREDHQKWHYLFMMVMLREKDPSEYNGWEQWVAEQMRPGKDGAVSSVFMPRNNALSLREHKEREEAEATMREAQAEQTYEMVKKLTEPDGTLAQLFARQDEMDKKLTKLGEGLGERSLQRSSTGRGSSKALVRGQSSLGLGLASPRS